MDCPVCGAEELSVFYEALAVPVFCNVLHEDKAAALAADRGDIRLGFCGSCAMIHNVAFEVERVRYAHGYENSLHGSPRFQAYAEKLAEHLIEAFGLDDGDILEVGGGRGEFMELLCAGGKNRGQLFDPSSPPDPPGAEIDRPFEIIREYFSDERTDYRADLIVTRHVLEHVPEPREFVGMIARAASRRAGTGVYIEVPNGLWTLRDLGIWDIIYEHCSYFVPATLRTLMEAHGLTSAEFHEDFDGQFLSGEARAGAGLASEWRPDQAELETISAYVDAFAGLCKERVEHWRAESARAAERGEVWAVWGAGSKGVTFLNAIGADGPVRSVVDINELKEGKFVPGTGQEVVLPSALVGTDVSRVIVMNPNYEEEIRGTLAGLGVEADVATV